MSADNSTRQLLTNVRRIEIRTRRLVDRLTAGAYRSVFKGRGIEFSEVREYMSGDDVHSIDWNVTARFGRPFVKKFVEERELSVMLLVDISASADFGSRERDKKAQAAELAALLSFSAIRNNDRVGLLMFTSDSEIHLAPRKGRKHVLRLVRELLAQPRRSQRTDIGAALRRVVRVLPRHSIIFLISDMLDHGYTRSLTIAGRRHDVVVCRITDPLELEMKSEGFLAVEDAETGEIAFFRGDSESGRDCFREAVKETRRQAENACRQARVDLMDILVGEDVTVPLLKFFQARRKRH